MDTPFYIGMSTEDRHNYAALLAGQYVDYDDDNDDNDNDDDDNEEE